MKTIKEEMMTEGELTDEEAARTDVVDNAIYDLVNSLVPNGKKIEWDREMLMTIADTIWECIKDTNVCTKEEFYP